MALLILQERLAEVLNRQFSFRVVNKQLRGRRGTVDMTVWLNPENRLKRVRTISIDCCQPETPDDVYYQYGLSYASRGWGGTYDPNDLGWPEVILSDFEKWALPFVREATEPLSIVRMILSGDVPPSEGMGGLHGKIMSSLRIAAAAGGEEGLALVAEYVRSVPMARSVANGLLMQPEFRDLGVRPWVRHFVGRRRGEYRPTGSRFA